MRNTIVVNPEDVRAIVAYVAHQSLKERISNGLISAENAFPALQELTVAQIEHAIKEALA